MKIGKYELLAVDGACLKVGESLKVNGSDVLSNVITADHHAKVYSIKMETRQGDNDDPIGHVDMQ